MTSTTCFTDAPHDDALPGLRALVTSDAKIMWQSALASLGAELRSIDISQLTWSVGHSATACYVAEIAWKDATVQRDYLVAATGLSYPAEVCLVSNDDVAIALWRAAADPFLPGLSLALDVNRVGALLSELGDSTPVESVRLRSYRPTRHAVVYVKTGLQNLFLKVVRPHAAQELQERHVRLAEEGVPVPASHGWSPKWGVVVLGELPGRTLRDTLLSGRPGLPFAGEIRTLLNAFPNCTSFGEVVPPHARVAEHVELLRSLCPSSAFLLDRLVDEVQALVEPAGECVGVHGDLHEAQLMGARRVTGVLDVDTFGIGEQVDDFANLLGHLSTLATTTSHRNAIDRYVGTLASGFATSVDPAQLYVRVAATVLGLATGPFRVQERDWKASTDVRIGLAEHWLALAQASHIRSPHKEVVVV